MSTTIELPPPAPPPASRAGLEPLPIMRISVERYHKMIEHGILGKDDKVELLRGIIVPKYSPYPAESDYPTDAYPLSIMPLSVERYHAMIEHGILGPDDRVELLRGLLVRKMPINPPHTLAKRQLQSSLARMLPPGWFVGSQDPISLVESEPEPDVTIISGKPLDYAARNPRPAELALVVEVSDSSLSHDRNFKRDLYAANGVATYWIVNLPKSRIEVYSLPSEGVYRESRNYGADDPVPVAVDGREIGTVRFADLAA